MTRSPAGAPECVRCFRSEREHDRGYRDQADDIQQRIWKALGWPCDQFTETAVLVFAANQAATGRWARGRSRQPARPATASAPPATALRGAALARAALTRNRNPREGT